MKKTLFAIGAMVAMVACSNDFVVKEAAQEAIGFDNAFVDNSTRSEVDPSLTTETLKTKGFGVYGFVTNPTTNTTAPNFTNEEISFNNTSGKWEYTSTQNWIPGAEHDFAAVAPYNAYTNVVATRNGLNLSFTNDGETDLLYDQVNDATHNAPVAFSFRHTLSKVKFSFVNGYNATNSSIRVKDIKIIDAYKTGDVVLNATTAWSNQATANDFVLNFGNAAENETDNNATVLENAGYAFVNGATVESYNELFMIPGAGTTVNPKDNTKTNCYTVQFTVELLVNGQEIKEYVHTIYTDFVPEPGKSYDLLAEITYKNIDPDNEQKPIEFTVTEITDWDNGNTVDSDDADNIKDNYPIQ